MLLLCAPLIHGLSVSTADPTAGSSYFPSKQFIAKTKIGSESIKDAGELVTSSSWLMKQDSGVAFLVGEESVTFIITEVNQEQQYVIIECTQCEDPMHVEYEQTQTLLAMDDYLIQVYLNQVIQHAADLTFTHSDVEVEPVTQEEPIALEPIIEQVEVLEEQRTTSFIAPLIIFIIMILIIIFSFLHKKKTQK